MDPLSAASGIAGLIAVAFKTCQLVGEYLSLVNEHKTHVETLHQELLLMKQVLDQLKDVIVEEKRNGRMRSIDDGDRNTVLGKAFADCTKMIEKIQDKLREPVNKFRKAVAKLQWPFEQKDILRMVEILRRYNQLFQLSLTVASCELLFKTFDAASEGLKLQHDNYKMIHELSAGVPEMAKAAEKTLKQTESLMNLVPTILQEVSSDIKEIRGSQTEAERREQERRMTDILDWLCPLSALQKHSDIKARRAPGTGAWFLQGEEVASWLRPESSNHELLCLGDPGVGKTNLASLVVDQLLDLRETEDIAVVHFYCDYREQQAQTPANCARNMLRQLSMQCNTLPTSVSDFYQRTRNEVKDQSWYIELRTVLCKVASTFKRCFIVIDALDEAEARFHMPGLLELLRVLRRNVTGSAPKIFATCRKHPAHILESFQEATKVTVTAKNEDLRTTLAKIIADHHDCRYIIDDKLKEDILVTLCANAHGMFLLPVLQIHDILSQLTKSEVRRALRNRSADLTEVFRSTIERILTLPADPGHPKHRRNLALKTLMWISHAKRVLTVAELQHALAVRLEDSELDRENFIEPRLIVDSCFGLVEIDRESSTIRFVHYSLQEYLKSHDHELFKNGDMEVTKTCLRYLSLGSVKDLHNKNRQTFIKALDDLPFLDYAATEWGFHATSVDPLAIEDVAIKFLKSNPHLLTAARVRDHRSPYVRKWHERMYAWATSDGAGISTCASFGLTHFVRFLIGGNKHPMLKARNMYGSTPLHEAAMKGYEDTAQLLLDYGADVLDLNIGKSIPLHLAVANGKIGMARILLKRQSTAQLNATGKDGWTVLHRAADIGDEEMVILLLQNSAMANVEDEKGMTPLHLAARKGHLEVVRLLCLSGAEVHSKALERLTPLDHAVTGGHLEVAKMLLDNGAQVGRRGADKWTALHRAARGGHESVVALLLERGADILAQDQKGEIPLHAAARSGSIGTVKLLLDVNPASKEEQLSRKGSMGSTPQDVAFFTINRGVYKVLREEEPGFNENASTMSGKLASAIESGSQMRVRRLLAPQLHNIDALVDGRLTALQIAIQEEQIEIVKDLLGYGADINSVGYHGWTPLHIAASIGNLSLTELCLLRGANVQALTHTAQSALHKACSSSNVLVVRALLEAGADKEATNQRGMRPIHIAAHKNKPDIVRLLIQDYGVDVVAADRHGATAAHWAERSGHLALSHYLKSQEMKWKKLEEADLT